MSVWSMPKAEKVPGAGGTMTSSISSSCARATACIGPAPPKATSEYSLGSIPCSTVIVRIASAILALMIASTHSAEQEVGVCHGRLRPAPAIARRPGVGPRALRTDAQGSRLQVGEGAATGADGVDVHKGHQHGETFQLDLRGDRRLALDDEASVEGGAPHVHAEQVRPAEGLA